MTAVSPSIRCGMWIWLGGPVALIFAIGWGRWMAIDPRALRHGRIDLLLVVLADLRGSCLAFLGCA